MLSEERQNQILDLLKQRQCVTVNFLCRNLYASGATIRRDLSEMSERGLLRRVRGGAALLEGINNDAPLLVRTGKNRMRKEKIARLAMNCVKDSSALFLDSSSTVTALAEKLEGFHNLTVVTNGLVTVNRLNEFPTVKLICSGGLLQNSSSFVGQTAAAAFESYQAEIVFFSCCGLTADFGPSEAREEVAMVKRVMCRNAKKRVLLCDATKFETDYFCRSCELSVLDMIITDEPPSIAFQEAFHRHSPRGRLIWE